MREFDDLTGETFGIWEVLEFDHMRWYGVDETHGMSYYRCRCKKCGKEAIVARSHLKHHPCAYHHGKCERGDS